MALPPTWGCISLALPISMPMTSMPATLCSFACSLAALLALFFLLSGLHIGGSKRLRP